MKPYTPSAGLKMWSKAPQCELQDEDLGNILRILIQGWRGSAFLKLELHVLHDGPWASMLTLYDLYAEELLLPPADTFASLALSQRLVRPGFTSLKELRERIIRDVRESYAVAGGDEAETYAVTEYPCRDWRLLSNEKEELFVRKYHWGDLQMTLPRGNWLLRLGESLEIETMEKECIGVASLEAKSEEVLEANSH